MKRFTDEKKESEYLRELLKEDVLCGKRGRIKIIRHANSLYEIQTDEGKGKFFNDHHLKFLEVSGDVDLNVTHTLDDKPFRRAVFYAHFNDRLNQIANNKLEEDVGNHYSKRT